VENISTSEGIFFTFGKKAVESGGKKGKVDGGKTGDFQKPLSRDEGV